MKILKRSFITIVLGIALALIANPSRAQMFWLGFNGGYQYNWFKSPKIDNQVTGESGGWNLGFFLKYGKRPFYQVEFRWMRALNTVTDSYDTEVPVVGDVPFHEFDMPVKVGYTIIDNPLIKWHVNGGVSIGTVFLFSTNIYEFERKDMTNPQFSAIGGTGIQFMNFIVDLDYTYHITDMFTGDEKQFGESFGSHLQVIAVKVGMVF
jgi:Outer membrane protein beta-barrel domain